MSTLNFSSCSAFKIFMLLHILSYFALCLIKEISSEGTQIFILNVSKLSNNTDKFFLTITATADQLVLFNKSIAQLTNSSQNGLKRLQVFNYQSLPQTIEIDIECIIPDVDNRSVSTILVQSSTVAPSFHQGILMLKQNINDYMLPFNLISEKYAKVIVEESNFQNKPVSYNYEPFLDTFWNEHAKDSLLLSWLPYFSMCEYKTSSRIFLQDVINPWLNEDYELIKIGRICNSTESWFWGHTLECTNKQIITRCVLEELQVIKTQKQVWWQNTGNPLFYFIKPSIISGSLISLDTQSTLTSIAQQYYKNLIPLSYETKFNLNQEVPNRFVLHLKIATISDIKNLQILKADLVATKMNQTQTAAAQLKEGETLLILQVQYLSNFQTLVAYGKGTVTYFLIYSGSMLVLLLIYKVVSMLANYNIHLNRVIRIIIFPISKGFSLALLLCGSFISFFFLISSKTNFVAISVNFDNNSLDNNWDSYAGRVGLSILLAGYFLLSTGISQSFKVLSAEQTKILIEDDLIQKKSPTPSIHSVHSGEQGSQSSDKSSFIINNMNSHRKYLVSCMFGYTFVLLLLYYAQISFVLAEKITFIVLGYPIIHKLTITIYRHYLVKDLLYLSALLTTLQPFLDIMVVGDMYIWQTVLFYFVKLLTQNAFCFALQILSQWVCLRNYHYLKANEGAEPSKLYRLLNNFRCQFTAVATESRYEKSIFYANLLSLRFASILTRPFLIMLLLLTIKYNFICKDFDEAYEELVKTFMILICFAPIDVFVMILGIKHFQTKLNLEILKCLEFNKFKFNRRKIRWINDSFVQNKSISYFYKEFQKFCFSSQMYLLIFIISFSLLTIMIGFKIILQVNYVAFVDPAMLLILTAVWLTGNLSSIVTSFVAIKLRIYERKEDGKMRAKLENVEKILKKTDYSEYFQTQSVKDYFLFFCKDWIIQNLTKIFDKEDFTDNSYEFLLKYKHYKSQLKKKKIQERKKIQRKNEEEQNKNGANQQKDKKIVIKLPNKQFNELAKPLLCSWLYIAKQFVFLKSLVRNLKQVYKKESCELCYMNIELEVIEKIEFSTLVNEYRLMNMGRLFDEEHFIQFYKHKQQHITLCIECKDKKLYLQKKNLDVNGSPRKLLSRWLILARSNLLHKNHKFVNAN